MKRKIAYLLLIAAIAAIAFMPLMANAQVRISGLPAVSGTPLLTDIAPIVNGGATKKATLQQILSLVSVHDSLTVINGATLRNDSILLGGTLIENTTINANNFQVYFYDNSNFLGLKKSETFGGLPVSFYGLTRYAHSRQAIIGAVNLDGLGLDSSRLFFGLIDTSNSSFTGYQINSQTGEQNIVSDTSFEIDAEDLQLDIDSALIINVGTDATANVDSTLDLKAGQEYYLRTNDNTVWEHGVSGFGEYATCCNHRTSHYTYNKTFGLDFNDIGTDTTSVNFSHRFNVVSATVFEHYRYTIEDTGAVLVYKDTSGNQDTVSIVNKNISYFNTHVQAITFADAHEAPAAVDSANHNVSAGIGTTILVHDGIDSFTIGAPEGIYNGQKWLLTTTGAITSLGITGQGGDSIGVNIVALAEGEQHYFTFSLSNTTWY